MRADKKKTRSVPKKQDDKIGADGARVPFDEALRRLLSTPPLKDGGDKEGNESVVKGPARPK